MAIITFNHNSHFVRKSSLDRLEEIRTKMDRLPTQQRSNHTPTTHQFTTKNKAELIAQIRQENRKEALKLLAYIAVALTIVTLSIVMMLAPNLT